MCLYHLVLDVKHAVQPLAVLLPGLFLIDLVSVGLRQLQEPPDGAQVFPKCTVLRVGALFPSEQLAQPTLEEQIISCLFLQPTQQQEYKIRELGCNNSDINGSGRLLSDPWWTVTGVDLEFVAFRCEIINIVMCFWIYGTNIGHI